MRRFVSSMVAGSLTLGLLALADGVEAPAAQAAGRSLAQVCGASFAPNLDVARAAKVRVYTTGKRRGVPVGLAKAKALAATLTADTANTFCTGQAYEDGLSSLADTDQLVAEGDLDAARQTLLDYLAGLSYQARSLPIAPRAGSTCTGFGSEGVTTPEEVRQALAAGAKAQELGQEDIANQAIRKAQDILGAWATAKAASSDSIGDLIAISARTQMIGGDDSSVSADSPPIDTATKAVRDRLEKVVRETYQAHRKLACKSTAAELSCFFKAAMVAQMIGEEPATLSADLEDAVNAMNDIRGGRKPRCPLLRYRLELEMTEEPAVRGGAGLRITPVVFEVRNGIIQPGAKGTMTLTGGTGGCYHKEDAAGGGSIWVQDGTAVVTGGSFPFTVAGGLVGDDLNIKVTQNAKYEVSVSGDQWCEAFSKLGEALSNGLPGSLNAPGWNLPAGVKDIFVDEATPDYFEPTNTIVLDRTMIHLTLLYPKD